jgi:hypothetical protein
LRRYLTPGDVPVAPQGFTLTGEFRVPNEGELFIPYTDGRVIVDTADGSYPFRNKAGGARHIAREAGPIVTISNPEPTVVIDLTQFDKDRKQPLVLTVPQATQLLRELDAVIL